MPHFSAGVYKTVIRQLLRYRRNEAGRIVKEDDHGPDALMCVMLHFPFIDEFDTAVGAMLSGTDRERLKITNTLLDGCVREYAQVVPVDGYCSMGVSVGTSGFYVVISLVPDYGEDDTPKPRPAMFIGKVKAWGDLDELIAKFNVSSCLISPQPEPHLVQKWAQAAGYHVVQMVIYTNDGISAPVLDEEAGRVTVDRTFALNAAYEEIRNGLWWIPPVACSIDNGDFYAQMKAPTRIRDAVDGQIRYRWVESGPLEHYRHAHAFDHICGEIARQNAPSSGCGMLGPVRESARLFEEFGRHFRDR